MWLKKAPLGGTGWHWAPHQEEEEEEEEAQASYVLPQGPCGLQSWKKPAWWC